MAALRSLFFKIIAVVLGFLVAFAVAEAAVRLVSPQEVGPVRFAFNLDLGLIPVPYQQGVRNLAGVFTFAYSNNSLGWRGPREYQEAKQTDYRVLCLGDSFTYGLGVNDDQTFAARIEKDLLAGHVCVEVMNAGCPGKGTDYALKLFQTRGAKFHPDLTVLCFVSNDFQDNERGEYYSVRQDGELQAKCLQGDRGALKTVLFHLPGYNWLISWSHAANLIKQTGVNILVHRASKSTSDAGNGLVISYKPRGGSYGADTNQNVTALYVRQLDAAVRRAGGSLMIFYIPIAQEVLTYRQAGEFSADEQAAQRLVAAQGGKLWSLTPLLALSGQPIERLYYQEGHWTAAAHDMAARDMSRHLKARLMSGRPDSTN